MPETVEVVESSPAPETPATPEFDHARGALVNLTAEQRSEYRKTGELPKPPEPKKEDSAPSKDTEQVKPAEPAGDSAPPQKTQEKPNKGKTREGDLTAEERIAQLESTIEKIRKGAGIERKTETAPVAQPQPPAQPQNYADWRKTFKPSEWVAEYAKANAEASYEDAVAAMNDHLDEVRGQFRSREQALQGQVQKWNAQLSEAATKYGEKFDEVKKQFGEKVVSDPQIPFALKEMLNDSEVLPDLIFTIAEKPEELARFTAMAKSSPTKAARYIFLAESLIREELESKPKETKTEEPPAQPKTSAPKPPTEVGGRATSPGDELESAARANDYRRFSAESTRRAMAAMKR